MSAPCVGILAFQGNVREHAKPLNLAGASVLEVRDGDALLACQGLVIPGGESTAMLTALAQEGMVESLKAWVRAGGVLWGTCAGAIAVARRVEGLTLPPLGLVDVRIRRNAYGRQRESFIEAVAGPLADPAVCYIRAPSLLDWGNGVRPMAWRPSNRQAVVALASARVLLTCYHAELGQSLTIQRAMVGLCQQPLKDWWGWFDG